MRILINIITSIALLYWFAGIMGTIMYIAASEHKKWSDILLFSSITLYPVIFGILYYSKDWDFLFIPSKVFAIVTIVVPVIAFIILFQGSIINKIRGVSEIGVTNKGDAVYLHGEKIKDADGKTFQKIDSEYSKDKNHVFYRKDSISGIDPVTFRNFDSKNTSQYFVDKSHVIFMGVILKNADPATFRELENMYSRDKDHVYFQNTWIETAHPDSFAVVSHSYFAKDRARIFHYQFEVDEKIDLASFEIVDDGELCAKDKNGVYVLNRGSKKIISKLNDADPATFTLMDRSYAKDKNHVFYLDRSSGPYHIIQGADAQSFVVTNFDPKTKSEAHDKSSYFLSGEVVKK
jgi:hypothetical protein